MRPATDFLILIILSLIFVIYYSFSHNCGRRHDSHREESERLVEPAEILKDMKRKENQSIRLVQKIEIEKSGQELAKAINDNTAPSPTLKDSDTGKVFFVSKEEFIQKFQQRPLEAWFSRATPFELIRPIGQGGTLDVIGEAGIIVVKSQDFEFRYSVSAHTDSCAAIKPPGQNPIVGLARDGTLAAWKLPIARSRDGAYIFGIQDKYFFVRYTDFTHSRQWDEQTREPRAPILTSTVLLYVRQTDGKFAYQGQLERYTDNDFSTPIDSEAFCQTSFNQDTNQQ